MKHKFMIALALSVAILAGCGNSQADPPLQHSDSSSSAESESTPDESLIDGFNGYAWGTSQQIIQDAEISAGAKEGIDYSEQEVSDNLHALITMDGNVAGYDAQENYLFASDGLTVGGYSINMQDGDYDNLVEKYSSAYGDPAVSKESTGWGKCSIWIDSQKNYIVLSEFEDGVLYVQSGSPYTETLSSELKEYHEIDLEQELNKFSNTSGI